MSSLRESKHTGKTYNGWTLLERDSNNKRKHICKCKCGRIESIFTSNVSSGKTKNCTDCQALKFSTPLVGTKFEYLQILKVEKVNGKAMLYVQCDCGIKKHIKPRIGYGKHKYSSCGQCNIRRKNKKTLNKLMSIGNRFGYLKIIKSLDQTTGLCLCDCGNFVTVKRHHLNVQYPSCGCFWINKRIEYSKRLVGMTFGYLKIIDFIGMFGPTHKTRAKYHLSCKCGNEFDRSISYLWGSKSCGCLQKENAPKGEDNYRSISKNSEILSIRELYQTGLYKQKDLSLMFGTNPQRICSIINRRSWKILS